MDPRETYNSIVKDVIAKYAKLRPSHGDIRLDTVFDDQQGHYALMQAGWDRGIRVRGNLLYITVGNDKVHIEYDGIEHGVVDELIMRGIASDDIVLSFLAEDNIELAAA